MISPAYERTVSLKTFFLAFRKRYIEAIFLFLPVALASLVVTQFVMKKNYASSFSFSISGTLSTSQYAAIKASLEDSDFSYVEETTGTADSTTVFLYPESAMQLANAGKTHSDGSKITANEIFQNISLGSFVSNSSTVSVTFASEDSAIVNDVLHVFAPLATKGLSASRADLSTLSYSSPTAVVKTSKENQYLLIAMASGFIIACFLPVIDEVVSDEVYDRDDIEMLGGSGYVLNTSKK